MLLKKRTPSILPLPVQQTDTLAQWLVRLSCSNLLLVALLGTVMRSLPFISHFPLQYRNLLHGHSHFAFGGWVMPLLLALILKTFPRIASAVAYRHWVAIAAILLLSGYGMLFSFPLQGYGAISIAFSTLSLVGSWYLAIVIWQALRQLPKSAAHSFLNWGLIYLVLSSAGPLSTGPIIAMGLQGSPLYYNAIYFYLHFTYNGWFVFAVFALWYANVDASHTHNGRLVFWLLNVACVPAYFLSVLWNKPPEIFYWIGAVGGVVQLFAVWYLLLDWRLLVQGSKLIRSLLFIVLFSFVLKIVAQVLSEVPALAAFASVQRNLVIAYLHLVLIGFVSLFMMAQMLRSFQFKWTAKMNWGLGLFLGGFAGTELVLAASGTPYAISYLAGWLFLFALCMLLGIYRIIIFRYSKEC